MRESMQDDNGNKTLHGLAIESAKSYMRFAVYIDDKIYTKAEDEKRFWNTPNELIELFAKEGIALTAYECCTVGQIESVVNIIERADIAIVDWEMYETAANKVSGSESTDTAAVVNLSVNILKKLFDARANGKFIGPRLICIYTKVPDEANDALKDYVGLTAERKGIHSFDESALRICIVNKDPESDQIALSEEIDKETSKRVYGLSEDDTSSSPVTSDTEESEHWPKRIIGKNEFVPFLVDQYAQIHRGILPTLALKVLGAVRDVMPRMMNSFSARLDNALIVEAALLPCPETAHRQAIDVILGYFASVLRYGDEYACYTNELVNAWVREHKFDECERILSEHNLVGERSGECGDVDVRLEWLNKGYFNFLKEERKVGKKKLIRLSHDGHELVDLVTAMFEAADNQERIEDICRQYSRLCHYRASCSDVDNANSVVLSLGSVVKTDDVIYMCVQQECDSLRITETDGRPFLFVPLRKAQNQDDRSDVLIEKECYRVDTHPYNMRIWKFSPMEGYSEIRGRKNNDKIVFYGEELNKDAVKNEEDKVKEFEWLFDLNDRVALKIVDDMSRQFARVAIDISEWLRLRSTQMIPIEEDPCIPVSRSLASPQQLD